MALAEIDVANMAMDYCGQAPIQNFRSPTVWQEELVNRHYDNVRQGILRKYTCWNFATAQASCTRIGTPPFDYSDQYQLPSDWLRFIQFSFPTGTIPPLAPLLVGKPFIIVGRTVLMNNGGINPLNIYYLRDMLDPSQWDACFLKVVARELAVNICYQLTKQMKLVEYNEKELMAEIADAISINGQEVPPYKEQQSPALDGRRLTYTNAFASPYTFID